MKSLYDVKKEQLLKQGATVEHADAIARRTHNDFIRQKINMQGLPASRAKQLADNFAPSDEE